MSKLKTASVKEPYYHLKYKAITKANLMSQFLQLTPNDLKSPLMFIEESAPIFFGVHILEILNPCTDVV